TPEQETQEALGVLAKQEEQTTLEVWEEDVVEASAEYLIVREEPLPAPYRALLAIPIIAQGRMYGGLLLLYTEPHRFSDDEVALAMAYGDQIALALANSRLQDHIERAAIEKERNRLARELHDTVTQEIFTASVLAESIPKVWEQHRVEAEANLQQLHQLTRGALAGLRTLLLELRPAVLEQKPLPDLLSQLGEAMATRSGVPITLAIADDAPPIPNPVKVAFYRIAQEALMNVAKYAQAHNIAVRLRYPNSGEAVQLDIQDDGQGFDTGAVPAGHFGVGMMRERARAVGATLRITSRREQGTRVAVKWVRSGRTASADQEYAAAGSTKHGDRRTD
ncbi:MAG TPA: GAF domain-containing sensor histidine kinase, partial [Ktedonobacterales bacterium]